MVRHEDAAAEEEEDDPMAPPGEDEGEEEEALPMEVAEGGAGDGPHEEAAQPAEEPGEQGGLKGQPGEQGGLKGLGG